MAGLIIETWETVADKQFNANVDWTNRLSDQSAAIEGDVLNLIKAGASPTVLVNNSSYPIAVAQITDSTLQVTLDRFETTPTVIYDWQDKQYSYNKMASDTEGHANAITTTAAERGAFNICQSSHSPASGRFKIQATGAAVSGRPTLAFKDVNSLALLFNKSNIPPDGRILVLSMEHAQDLYNEDRVLANQNADHKNGIIMRVYGFDVYVSGQGAVYESATGAKQALGAAEAAGFFRGSFAFGTRSVLKAWKPIKGFHNIDDPLYRGTIIGFNKHGIIIPRREGVGTIYS
jgi:hypothetical protein